MGEAREPARAPQLAYSEIQAKTHDEARRRRKARKIVAVLRHFFGREDLAGLVALDVGCSTGFTADVLSSAGCRVLGLDIDVPGLSHARSRFGEHVDFLCGDGAALPLPDGSVDIVICNQVYEHIVDPDGMSREISRVLAPGGAAFFGLGNKYQVIEPHYRLPFLSWVPERVADRYVAASGRAGHYYERFRTRRQLVEMLRPLTLWDYTYSILADRDAFDADDIVPKRLSRAPRLFWRALQPVMPTFIWIGTTVGTRPAGAPTRVAPALVR